MGRDVVWLILCAWHFKGSYALHSVLVASGILTTGEDIKHLQRLRARRRVQETGEQGQRVEEKAVGDS